MNVSHGTLTKWFRKIKVLFLFAYEEGSHIWTNIRNFRGTFSRIKKKKSILYLYTKSIIDEDLFSTDGLSLKNYYVLFTLPILLLSLTKVKCYRSINVWCYKVPYAYYILERLFKNNSKLDPPTEIEVENWFNAFITYYFTVLFTTHNKALLFYEHGFIISSVEFNRLNLLVNHKTGSGVKNMSFRLKKKIIPATQEQS